MTAESSPLVARLVAGPVVDGPLNGVRTTVKELVAVRGVALSANTDVELPAALTAPEHETPVVGLLRDAGARIASIATTHELAWGITTWAGGRRVANPLVEGRVAGGSSGGVAGLIAAGAVELGIGTDTAGSVRIPAAWCDVVGWKPTFDLVSTDHVLPLAPGFDTVGFLARDVGLLATVAEILGVDDADDRPLRIAELHVPGATSDPRLGPVIADALARLDVAGHDVTRAIEGPEAATLVDTYATLQLDASLDAHRDVLGSWPEQADRYGEAIRRRLRAAERLDATTVAAAQERQVALRATADTWFTGVDALVLPTTGCPPPTQDRPDEVDIDGDWHDLRSVVLPHTTIANLLGAPAVNVPARIGDEPTGVQLLTPAGTDGRALRLAAQLVP
ncbi:MAG: amidase [Actinomycetota bacterium]